MKYLKRFNEGIEDELNKLNATKRTRPVNKSKEEAWYDFLDKKFPAPAIIGEENKLVNGRVVEGKKVFYILDKNFEPLEEVSPVFINGELNEEVLKVLKKYRLSKRDIIMDDNIEETKMSLFNEFSIDNWETNFQKESSPEFMKFEK
jgi:hypothetical protein